jgi:hypothetical protein
LNLQPPVPRKLSAKFVGPFAVLKRVGKVAYRLELPPSLKIHNVFHVSVLRRYNGSKLAPPDPISVEEQEEFEVEEILQHR